ncbi:MAG TPA: YjjG family noncanonical pyrimidine nucleotidase [Flavihumibacter sp.]|nr:YjjG family noncanonical pyrimidine nucleotidase [Bacteroidota bacterium]HOA37885.1 YjjG family noncanonical pyrimidine nucleotidase [Flavihumibacter sp.]HPZ87583.1 YjjG family noncanonical pyrimidine nucleotidase [Flavihumibacter sp.]HQD08761.1 YjjG family noncanonical pyrimidine nucleotidase [Flavihumibacter sp.]
MKAYRYLFFDLDHTLWDFDSNAKQTLEELHRNLSLYDRGITDFDRFYRTYLLHNEKLWDRYRKGFIKVDELRWKRMWHTLLDFKIGDDKLARNMADEFLRMLPSRRLVFPHTMELLNYLRNKGYEMHLITNGFEKTQHEKIKNAGLSDYFGQVITSEGSNSLKPHKEIFDYAFKLTGANAANSVMIGDSIEADIIGAANAGMDQIFVNHTNAITDFKPTYTVYSLKELETIF